MTCPDFFIVDRKELVYYLMGSPKISWPLWTLLGMGVVITVVGAVCDWRVMLLGLIISLTMVPSLAFFIYFTKLIDTHIMINTLPHTIELRPERYFVTIFRGEPRKNDAGEKETEWIEAGTMTIFDSKVTKRVDKGQYTVLHLIDSPVKVLYIPRGMQPEPVSCEIKRNIMKYSNENTEKFK